MKPVKEPPMRPRNPTLTVGKINLIRYWVRRATLEAIQSNNPFTSFTSFTKVRSH